MASNNFNHTFLKILTLSEHTPKGNNNPAAVRVVGLYAYLHAPPHATARLEWKYKVQTLSQSCKLNAPNIAKIATVSPTFNLFAFGVCPESGHLLSKTANAFLSGKRKNK